MNNIYVHMVIGALNDAWDMLNRYQGEGKEYNLAEKEAEEIDCYLDQLKAAVTMARREIANKFLGDGKED